MQHFLIAIILWIDYPLGWRTVILFLNAIESFMNYKIWVEIYDIIYNNYLTAYNKYIFIDDKSYKHLRSGCMPFEELGF